MAFLQDSAFDYFIKSKTKEMKRKLLRHSLVALSLFGIEVKKEKFLFFPKPKL